jgi:hypothetical protein
MFVNELSVLCKRDEGSFNIVNLTYILLHFSDDTIEYGLLITRRAPEVYTVHQWRFKGNRIGASKGLAHL